MKHKSQPLPGVMEGMQFELEKGYDEVNSLIRGRDRATGEAFNLRPERFVQRFASQFYSLLGRDALMLGATIISGGVFVYRDETYNKRLGESWGPIGDKWQPYAYSHGDIETVSKSLKAASKGIASRHVCSVKGMDGGVHLSTVLVVPLGNFSLFVVAQK